MIGKLSTLDFMQSPAKPELSGKGTSVLKDNKMHATSSKYSNKSKPDTFERELGRQKQADDPKSHNLRPPQNNKREPEKVDASGSKQTLVKNSEEVKSPEKRILEERVLRSEIESLETNLNPLTQRNAMKKFIFKMQDELDVAPAELIAAFGTMDPQDLLKPPEDSIDAFVGQLDLKNSDQPKAKLLFNQMLTQTAHSSMAEYLQAQDSDLSLEVLTEDDLRKRNLSESIDTMNSKFFVDNKSISQDTSVQKMKQALSFEMAKTAYQQTVPGEGNGQVVPVQQNSQAISVNQVEGSLEIPKEMQSISQQLDAKINNLNEISDDMVNIKAEKQMASAAKAGGLSLNFNSFSEAEGEQVVAQAAAPATGQNIDLEMSAPNNQNVETNTEKVISAPVMSEFSSEGEESAEDGDSNSYLTANKMESSAKGVNAKQDFIVSTSVEPTAEEDAGNVRELVNQARLMVKKGGGEMKVQMSPEGLGKVAMKVNVENGRVNVEMIAENNDAKKIIEKGMGELKATLASHKLNVEQIKVDVSNNLTADLSQDQGDAERQFAQQFMGQFRRDNQSFHQGFMGQQGVRSYSSQTDDPAENLLLNNVKPRKTNADRRLDLVA